MVPGSKRFDLFVDAVFVRDKHQRVRFAICGIHPGGKQLHIGLALDEFRIPQNDEHRRRKQALVLKLGNDILQAGVSGIVGVGIERTVLFFSGGLEAGNDFVLFAGFGPGEHIKA